jgi:hypothetical protein
MTCDAWLRCLLLRCVLLVVGAATAACLAPPPPAPSSFRKEPGAQAKTSPIASTRTGPDACAAPAGGAPRLIIRRGYIEDPDFRLVASEIRLDGTTVFSSTDENRLNKEVEVVLDAPSAPGGHEITSEHRLYGRGSSTGGYRFRIPTKHSVEVRPVGATCVTLSIFFRSDPALRLEERPAFRVDTTSGGSGDASSVAKPKDAG